MKEEQVRGSFETKVTLKMLCLYFWTWIIGGTITHKNIIIEKNQH